MSQCSTTFNKDVCLNQMQGCKWIPPATCVDKNAPQEPPPKSEVCPTVTDADRCRGVYECTWSNTGCSAPLPFEVLLNTSGSGVGGRWIMYHPELLALFRETDVSISTQMINSMTSLRDLSEVRRAATFLVNNNSDISTRAAKIAEAATARHDALAPPPPPPSPSPHSPPPKEEDEEEEDEEEEKKETFWTPTNVAMIVGVAFLVLILLVLIFRRMRSY